MSAAVQMERGVDWPRVMEAAGRFGVRQFRPGQRELIEAVLTERDAIGVMPTGGGKSLCYQLPALADHLTIRGRRRNSGRFGGATVAVRGQDVEEEASCLHGRAA